MEPLRYTPIHEDAMVCETDGSYVRFEDHEASRKSDMEVVQALVDALDWCQDLAFAHAIGQRIAGQRGIHPDFAKGLEESKAALALAKERLGITPDEQPLGK